jgi:hypothetical protein
VIVTKKIAFATEQLPTQHLVRRRNLAKPRGGVPAVPGHFKISPPIGHGGQHRDVIVTADGIGTPMARHAYNVWPRLVQAAAKLLP